MMQFTSEKLHEFVTSRYVRLTSTHRELSIPIINRIYAKMSHGLKFADIHVCDSLIVNGHHRYISALLAGIEIGFIETHKTSATRICDWKDVNFVEIDYDTKRQIEEHNRNDAYLNDIPLQDIYDMLK